MADFYQNTYNPDVLSCLANLSNDEVFTPPEIANRMLDLLPQELFHSPDTTFLDPATKSGVFLREIAKRLLVGLEDVMPNLQTRIDHIYNKQLFGIAITEMTSLLSRRSVYCSKYPNGKYSVTRFADAEGNVRFKKIQHSWRNGKCVFCGASQSEYDRDESLENHAYELIHTTHPERIFNMKFDVIIGNPPYQLETGGAGRQATPIYQRFVAQAKKLNPRFLTMIIPSRWFAGGMGLDDFRKSMLEDEHVRSLTDYANAKDCFPQMSISGGVCYFLWDRDNPGTCRFTNIIGNTTSTLERKLSEFPVVVRYNEAVEILRKTVSANTLATIASSLTPFGLSTNFRGTQEKTKSDDLPVQTSVGVSYIVKSEVTKGFEYIGKYKVLMSKTGAEHAGEPDRDGKYRVLTSSMRVMEPDEICTHSYFVVGAFDNRLQAENLLSYIKTKFLRFLVLLSMSSINVSKTVFQFVPLQDFSEPWTDEKLYRKYSLTKDETAFIESMIRPMDVGEADDE
ncbi:MAG: Eco57I restriction-modification methylase domain-containing protein [Sphaerochaeta sp.]|jgi:site-specific DNA-methyltransferase (adenine-specific)|nr:Eco57I restriction-modification methylase domain-containing protein [Sphaerochaeta sp.]